jgi:TetR/AcrR family transcriptional repressor of nem operon
MRYEKGHKDTTRKRIVEVASKRFRSEGVEGVGVAGLMADAGLTHGGFYSHFRSKEELVREAVTEAFTGTNAELERVARTGADGLEAIVRTYLSPQHRDRPDLGCAAAALVSEIARHPDPTRLAFTGKLEELIGLIAAQLPVGGPAGGLAGDLDERRRCATGIFAVMMGALQLARAAPDAGRSEQILENGVEAALSLARNFAP